MNDATAAKVHWSFWTIVAVALIFNVLGCLNFLSQLNPEAVASMPEQYRTVIETRPAWATGTFAVAVFGGALGCLLLVLGKSAAYYVFIAAALSAAITVVQFHSVAGLGPPGALVGGLMQVLVAAFLVWYSKHAAVRGWIS